MIVDVLGVVRPEVVHSGNASDDSLRDHHLDDAEVLGVRSASAEALAHDLVEGEAEVPAEEGVDAGINGGVAVAEPEEDGEEDGGDALRAEGPHHVHREEGHPAHDEPSHDDPCKRVTQRSFNMY